MNLLTLAYRLAVQNVKYGQIRLPLAKRMKEYSNRERIIEEHYLKLFVLWDVMPDKTDENLREMLYRHGRTASFMDVIVAAGEAGGRKYLPELYDAPNLPKINTSNPPNRKSLIPDNVPKPKQIPVPPKKMV